MFPVGPSSAYKIAPPPTATANDDTIEVRTRLGIADIAGVSFIESAA
jgi:hypothetical protein